MFKRFILVGLFLVFLSSGVFALDSVNATLDKSSAEKCLYSSRSIMNELRDANFSIQRINDTIKIANDLYLVQVDKEKTKSPTDFNSVINYCNSIVQIRVNAYKAKDLLYSLEKTYSSFFKEMNGAGANTSSVDILMNQVRQDMVDERYENVIQNIPLVESKIVEVQASATTFNLFYKSISRGLKEWFISYQYYLYGLVLLIILTLLVYKFKLKRYFIKKKIDSLESEKVIIKDMVKLIQKGYFEGDKISESEYNIKTKKFAELIRDIERQIPLYQEELARLDHDVNGNLDYEYPKNKISTSYTVKRQHKSKHHNKHRTIKSKKKK